MTVRHSLLGLLVQQPRYGYELRAAFTALAGGSENWNVTPAQIYTTLNRMRESGLVEIEPTDNNSSSEKRKFTITPAGLEELNRWLLTDVRDEPQQDAFYLKLMLSRDLDFVDTNRLIQIQRNGLYRDLHRITQTREKMDQRTELARIMIMDKAIMHLEADLRWLDMVESRLDEVVKQPPPEVMLRPRGRPQKNSSVSDRN